MKENCVSCGTRIPPWNGGNIPEEHTKISHYRTYGNYCKECTADAGNNLQKKVDKRSLDR